MSTEGLKAMFSLDIPKFDESVLRRAYYAVFAVDKQCASDYPLVATKASHTSF